jgi:hypothetical protein
MILVDPPFILCSLRMRRFGTICFALNANIAEDFRLIEIFD